VSFPARTIAGWLAAISAVVVAGVWLGHRLDPTWKPAAPVFSRPLPFPVPAIEFVDPGGNTFSTNVLRGHSSIARFVFPGCGQIGQDVAGQPQKVEPLLSRLAGSGTQVVTFAIGGDETLGSLGRQSSPDDLTETVVEVPAAAISALVTALGLAASSEDLFDLRRDAERLLFLIDAAAQVRGVYDLKDDRWTERLTAEVEVLRGEPIQAAVARPPVAIGSPGTQIVADFVAMDQEGQPVTRQILAGHPWVADFIFTTCAGPCPLLTARLAALRRLVDDPGARFVSFSVDPEHDTPAALQAYASRWGAPDARWRLLRADLATIRRVASSLGAVVTAGLHSDRLFLVDARGIGQGSFSTTDPELARRLRSMLAARPVAASPLSAPSGGESSAAEGRDLLLVLGCRGCHDDVRVAPPLAGIGRRRVALADGRLVSADAAYLRRAILDPGSEIVAGYRPAMPSYDGQVDERDLQAIVTVLEH
jgi:protein SCO1